MTGHRPDVIVRGEATRRSPCPHVGRLLRVARNDTGVQAHGARKHNLVMARLGATHSNRVMAGLHPAISRGTVLDEMAGSSPAMTAYISGGSAAGGCGTGTDSARAGSR
jgi:hypothetical protein